MSRRRHNLARIDAAARSASVADAWVGVVPRRRVLSLLERDGVARTAIERLLTVPRVQRRTGSHAGALFELFKDHPELAPWLASPHNLERLQRLAGAALAGGTFVKLIAREHIAAIVDALGEEVWRFGIEHGGASFVLSNDADAVVDMIDAEGARALRVYLKRVAPDLHADILQTAGLLCSDPAPSLNPDRDVRAVQTVLGRATP